MKYLLNAFLWAALASLLVNSGIYADNWRYWAICGCALCMCVNVILR